MIDVQFAKDFADIDTDLGKLEKLVRSVCDRFDISQVTVSVSIADDERISEVNKKFLKCNGPTDVISFDLSETGDEEKVFDIIVNGQMAKEQGQKQGHGPAAELALYVTHGLLHNLGFDDSIDEEAKKMHETEDEILKQEGFGSVFNSR